MLLHISVFEIFFKHWKWLCLASDYGKIDYFCIIN